MAVEVFGNNAVSYLTAALDSSTDPAPISVHNGSVFPRSGNFRIQIDSEILLVTSVSGNTFTASRAQEGTQIVAHENGSTVKHIFTAGGLNKALDESVVVSSYSALPSAGRAGRVAFTSDDRVMLFSDGSNWLPYGPFTRFYPPVLSDLTWVNQGASRTATQLGTVFNINSTLPNGSSNRGGLVKTALTPPFKLTICYTINKRVMAESFFSGGIMEYESSSGKFITWEQGTFNFINIGVHTWNNGTSFAGTIYGWAPYDEPTYLRFMQIHDDGANVNYNFSYDGIGWYTQYSRARTSFINADKYGVMLSEGQGSVTVFSFKEESA
jgi:hypothetical protein